MGLLDEILRKKKERLNTVKQKASFFEVRKRAEEIEKARNFKGAIKRDYGQSVRLIAEIKKASPSRGGIRADFNPEEIAKIYHERGVDAISVLTEEDFFKGSIDYINIVKELSQCPILRKDFILEEYQVYETRVSGADALLLIGAILSRGQADELLCLSRELELTVLYEVHNHKELDMALLLNCEIIGINNRNLDTLEIDLDTTLKMIRDIPEGKVIVSESGINTRDDIMLLKEAGVHAVLIGTSIMESQDIGSKIDELRMFND